MANEKENKILKILMTAVLFTAVFFAARQAAVNVSGSLVENKTSSEKIWHDYSRMQKYCVVVDAGHGGSDPGKVGVQGSLEKDINLQIARKLQTFLEQSDVKVVMTRENEGGLYDEDASNKKVQDMKRRIVIMEEVQPDIIVSVHQNSYGSPEISGPQVFFYTGSTEGQTLAETVQERLIEGLKPQKERMAKANDSYYLIKKTKKPIVIVECGFLSNPEEEALLTTDLYQEKTAWHIHMAVMKYLHGMK